MDSRLLFPFLLICVWTNVALAQLPDDFYDTRISDQFVLPLGITFDNNGQGYLWEKDGKVYVLDENDEILPAPLLDLSEEVSSWKDHGLNGFCLDQEFLTNGYVYCYYVVDLHHYWHYGTAEYHPDTTVIDKPTFGRITRYQADPATSFTTIIPDSRTVLLGETISTGVPILYDFHGLGSLVQGTDRSLLFSSGETTGGLQIGIGNEPGDVMVPQAIDWGIITPDEDLGAYKSQYLGSLNGKILRIDPDTGDGLASNPYYDATQARSAQSRVWGWGLRNPYRIMVRPNTGSHYLADGDPGTLIIGDVGNGAWEEINIQTRGGQNFGWPVLEGFFLSWKFWNQDVPNNPLAPNPLANCTEDFLNFRQLLALPNENGPFTPGNPCDPSQPIPDNLNPAYAEQPILTWSNALWNQPARALIPAWNDVGDPEEVPLGTPDQAIEGEPFDGYSSLAGIFYAGETFPEAYRGKYFHCDYSGWIKVFDLDENNVLTKVERFHDDARDIIHLAQNTSNGALYYTNALGELHKITYGGNPAPVAVIEADRFFGPGPLTVQFSALSSYDPNNDPMSYFWEFGDGSTSDSAEPTHTFNTTNTGPQSFTVRLTATDAQGATHVAERVVSLNNTPPQVEITSFKDGDQYPLGYTSLLRLLAKVTDAEHATEDLQYTWRTYLHHNLHFHPDPPIYEAASHFLISPLGCEEETYYYRIELTVTDPAGLATKVSQQIYPYCGDDFVEGLTLEGTVAGAGVELDWVTTFAEDIAVVEVQRSPDYFRFTTIGEVAPRNASTTENYAFFDANPERGSNFYRIKVTTTSGAFTYSNLFEITYPQPIDWEVFPNPATQHLTFNLRQAQSEKVLIELYNVAGQHLRQFPFAATPNEAWSERVLIAPFPPGLYSYRIVDGERSYTGRVIIQ
ncbi:MAG: PKD domain-containing protein [Bacteroidota bacterium]